MSSPSLVRTRTSRSWTSRSTLASFVGSADAEVSELAGVAEGGLSGRIDAVVADAELADVTDG
jgi:hypothetical protein